MINTLSEFEKHLKGNVFFGHTGSGFARILYGILVRLENNGVSWRMLDQILVDSGFKGQGNYRRYLRKGEAACDDIFAFDRLCGETADIPQHKVPPSNPSPKKKPRGRMFSKKKGQTDKTGIGEYLLNDPKPDSEIDPLDFSEIDRKFSVVISGNKDKEKNEPNNFERPVSQKITDNDKKSGGEDVLETPPVNEKSPERKTVLTRAKNLGELSKNSSKEEIPEWKLALEKSRIAGRTRGYRKPDDGEEEPF